MTHSRTASKGPLCPPPPPRLNGRGGGPPEHGGAAGTATVPPEGRGVPIGNGPIDPFPTLPLVHGALSDPRYLKEHVVLVTNVIVRTF